MFLQRPGRKARSSPPALGFRRAALVLAINALVAINANAAEDPVLEQALSLIKANDAAGAFELLSPLELEHAGETRFDYLFGIAAFDSGHVTRAIFALERVVAEQPDNSLAHAELGRAYLAAGETAAADTQFQAARKGRVPTDAAAAIDRVLGAIAPPPVTGRPVIRSHVDVSFGADSNLNSATTNGVIALPAFGGLTFNLDPSAQRRGSVFMAVGAGADAQVPLNARWSLIGSVNARQTVNESNNDLRQGQADGSIGASWTRDADTVSASLQTNSFWLGGNRYRNADGVSAQWQHALGASAQFSTFAQWSKLTYPGQDNRNADRSVLGAGYAKAFENSGTTTIVYGSVYGASEVVKASGFDNFGHHAIGVRAGAELRTGPAVWFTALQYESRRYGGPEPFFDTTRRDRQGDLTVGVHFVPAPLWRLTPQITSTRSSSNVGLYDYRRTVVQLMLRRDFN